MSAPSPTLDLLSRLWLHEPDPRTLAAAREIPPLAPYADDAPAAMAAAYADLFLLNVYPYGTAFTDPSGELNGPAAEQFARRYEERAFRPPELDEVGAPDHVGLGLAFLDHLAGAGEKDLEFSSSFLEWVPVCCLAVEREPSAQPFYKAMAELTRQRLMEDIPDSPPLPARGERVGVRGEEEEEVGLSHILRYLLAPARSGFFVSRAKLGRLARAAGVRLPFGPRFDVGRALFQTAGECGKVGPVLDLVETELAAWEAAYRAWSEEHPRWAPSAALWLGRTNETRRRLAEMWGILDNPPELDYVGSFEG
jgi:TorA maturation chaperone TorD